VSAVSGRKIVAEHLTNFDEVLLVGIAQIEPRRLLPRCQRAQLDEVDLAQHAHVVLLPGYRPDAHNRRSSVPPGYLSSPATSATAATRTQDSACSCR
jgi:hypothetical protein